MLRPETASLGAGQTCPDRPEASHSGKKALRVIASSIRKGNIIEQDGKLYVVLSAENIHPGKGTPVSQSKFSMTPSRPSDSGRGRRRDPAAGLQDAAS